MPDPQLNKIWTETITAEKKSKKDKPHDALMKYSR